MQSGKAIRLNRILPGNGKKALIVAFDHGFTVGPIPGTENPLEKVRTFVDAKVDGVLLTPGAFTQYIEPFLKPRAPALLMRLDWTNVWYRPGAVKGDYSSCLAATVEAAVRNGADAVVTYLFFGAGDPAVETAEMAKNATVNRECERYGIPHVVESMARGKNVSDPADPAWIALHTRMASELGADLIKTDYTGDPATMRAIVESCPTPILIAGGPRKASDDDSLALFHGAVEAGAAGVICGRNIFQSGNAAEFLARARKALDGGLQ